MIQIWQIYLAISSKENESLLIRKQIFLSVQQMIQTANRSLPNIAEDEMFRQKLCQFSQVVPFIILCLAILLAQVLSIQSSNKNDGGITYFDNSQNIKIKDRTIIRNNVYLIKVDCGNICNTSYESELTLHKGKIKSFESNTSKKKKIKFVICIQTVFIPKIFL